MKAVNDTINNIQDALVAMRSDFEKALETSNTMQLKTQEDELDLRSLLVTVGNNIKLMETGGWKPPVPGVKGVKAINQDWSEDPDLPQGWILDRFDSLDKATKEIESKIKNVKVELGALNKATNLENNVDIMTKDMKVNVNNLNKIQKETLKILKHKGEKELSKEDSEEAEIHETTEVEDITSERVKDKGIIFTSSIGKYINKERLELATNSDIELVTTYTLEKYDNTKDPDLHLLNMIEDHVNRGISFVVFGVGTNDITALNKMQPNKKEILEKCQYQSQRRSSPSKTWTSTSWSSRRDMMSPTRTSTATGPSTVRLPTAAWQSWLQATQEST